MLMSVTIAPSPSQRHERWQFSRVPLLDLAEFISDDCGGVPVTILDGVGHVAARVGGPVADDDVELF